MNTIKKIYVTIYLLVLIAFTGCNVKVAVKPAAQGKTTMNMELDLGEVLTRTLDGAMAGLNEIGGTNGSSPIFDVVSIRRSITSAGFTDVSITSKERSKLSLAFTGRMDFVSYTKTKTVLRLSPSMVKKFSASLGPEFKSVMDLFMAPVVTGEEMPASEYKDLVALVYGEKLADDLEASKVEITIASPAGRSKTYSIPLVELLTLSEEKELVAE